jgi:hypothetical protein
MVFGHNTNIKLGAVTFHVQTEDRGESHALIDTTVYFHGRVLHRRSNNYYDLLPLDEDRTQALKLRLDEQHHKVLAEIRSGELHLAVPTAPDVPRAEARTPEPPVAACERRKLALELVNAGSWLKGRQASLELSVRKESGDEAASARFSVEIEGASEHSAYEGETGQDGLAHIRFEMPRITSSKAALVIRAEDRDGSGQLRFALRAKPRVPTV